MQWILTTPLLELDRLTNGDAWSDPSHKGASPHLARERCVKEHGANRYKTAPVACAVAHDRWHTWKQQLLCHEFFVVANKTQRFGSSRSTSSPGYPDSAIAIAQILLINLHELLNFHRNDASNLTSPACFAS